MVIFEISILITWGFLFTKPKGHNFTGIFNFFRNGTRACLSKVPKLFRRISGATIPFISSQRRGSKPSNFVILLVFHTLKTLKDHLFFKAIGLQFDKWLFIESCSIICWRRDVFGASPLVLHNFTQAKVRGNKHWHLFIYFTRYARGFVITAMHWPN